MYMQYVSLSLYIYICIFIIIIIIIRLLRSMEAARGPKGRWCSGLSSTMGPPCLQVWFLMFYDVCDLFAYTNKTH